jgi:hypothetical protein
MDFRKKFLDRSRVHRQAREPRNCHTRDRPPRRKSRQATVQTLRGKQAFASRRLTGPRCSGKRRGHSACHQRHQSARRQCNPLPAADTRGARPRFSLACAPADARTWGNHDLQPFVLRRRTRGAGARHRAKGSVVKAVQAYSRVRKAPGRGRYTYSQILFAHQPRRAACPLQGTPRYPHRNWKIQDSDYTEREYWPAYITAFEDAMRKTTAARAPWYVIPSNHKWFRDLAISSILIDTLEEMNLQIPKPSVDLRAIRLRYHSAKIEQKKDNRLKILPGESQGHTGKSVRQSKRVHAPKG